MSETFQHPSVAFGRIGVLIVNLGTPEGTSYGPMRRYLKEFLSDTRVIEIPRFIWWFILQLFILPFRPGRKGKDYAKIWNRQLDESPLKTITRGQAQALQMRLGGDVVVDWAMRYGLPAIPARLDALKAQGCDHILIVPLYPQYAAATTASVSDAVFRHLMKRRWVPSIRIAPPWHDADIYIEALARSIHESLQAANFAPDVLVASFHGTPKDCLLKGDPYHCHCRKTARLLRERMGMSEEHFLTTFQSRFGKAEWLQPYTDKTMEGLGKAGVQNVAILAPGFVADCLETLEELAMENREIFIHSGGKAYHYIPCLNDSAAGVDVLEAVIRRELQGWL
jgi:ferrochelatase